MILKDVKSNYNKNGSAMMTEKRFTLTYEKIGKYFNMGIVDHETKQPFDDTTYEFNQCSFQDSKDEMEDLTQLLNALHEENVKLKARNKYLAMKIQRERNIHVKEHEKWENETITENEKIKQQRDFYYARLQKIIKVANGDVE